MYSATIDELTNEIAELEMKLKKATLEIGSGAGRGPEGSGGQSAAASAKILEEAADAWSKFEIKNMRNSVNYYRSLHNKRISEENDRDLEHILGSRAYAGLRKSLVSEKVLEKEKAAQAVAVECVRDMSNLLKDNEQAQVTPVVVNLTNSSL